MGRGSTQILIREIIKSLAEAPMSATEIAEMTNLDRTAIARYLDVLEEAGFIVSEKQGVSKKYILTSNYRHDTFFGLPLTAEQDRVIDSMYSLIQKKWKKLTGRKLLKTTAQKIINQVIDECNLDIPHGWYIFGGICVKPFEMDVDYPYTELGKDVVRCINETISIYSVNTHEYESKQMQYRKARKPLYDNKEEILRLLYSPNFSKNSMFVWQKFYRRFLYFVPEGDEEYFELINEYDTILLDVTMHWNAIAKADDEDRHIEFKQMMIKSFESLWRLVAMLQFKHDLKPYYLTRQLDEHFRFDIAQAKEEVVQLGAEISEIIPIEEPEEPIYQKINEIRLKSVADEESLKTQNEELENIRKKLGEKAYFRELRRRSGLE